MNSDFPIYHLKNPTIPKLSVSSDPNLKSLIPLELWHSSNPPKELFIQGQPQALELLKLLPERGLAIVGTRNPQLRSKEFLIKRIQELKNSNLIIISGMARGIDSIAHESAIHAGLPTIAILGTCLHSAYPHETLPLRKRLLQSGGLVVSEFPPGTQGYKSNFLQRNRIIAHWSKATWVVEAGFRSGALNTARWAREQNRTCFTVPGYPGDPFLGGNQTLLDRDHALPFWGVHSLGASWLELASYPLNPLKALQRVENPQQKTEIMSQANAESLTFHIKKLTSQRGGAQVQEVLDWALTGDWDPGQFFAALQIAIQKQWIKEQFGVLISIE